MVAVVVRLDAVVVLVVLAMAVVVQLGDVVGCRRPVRCYGPCGDFFFECCIGCCDVVVVLAVPYA